MERFEHIRIPYVPLIGKQPLEVDLVYRLYGPELGKAPVVLVTHALTGCSEISGENGWWKQMVGPGKLIDTDVFTVLGIDVPGNGSGKANQELLERYEDFILEDMARLFLELLGFLGVEKVYAGIGGSIGGALLWQIASLKPALFRHLVPVATHFETTAWVKAQCEVQNQILRHSERPVYDARMHAMTFYRTPQSLELKDQRGKGVVSWLHYHGEELEKRFSLPAYRLMNHLLTTIKIGRDGKDSQEVAAEISADILMVGIDSDWFFLAEENTKALERIRPLKANIEYKEIKSPHGHDAFLMEYEQLEKLLSPIFK